MSTATERAKAKAERLSSAGRASSPATVVAAESPRTERARPVRMTLDLAPVLHEEFEDWVIAAGRRLGSKVNRVDVLRILLHRLLEDDDLAAEVVAALRADARRVGK